MPTLIHLADEKDAKSILRNGIKIGKYRAGVFFMPVTHDFFVSHQWLRELKRGGANSYVGVYFKLTDAEEVWFGRYNERHRKAPLGEAIGQFMGRADRLGCEFLLERKVEAKEILRVASLPQVVGWRYAPESHRKETLCACPVCISPGEINARRKREKLEPPVPLPPYPELVARLKTGPDAREMDTLLRQLGRKRRKADPMELAFLLAERASTLESLALTLPAFRHPNAFAMLAGLLTHPGEGVRRYGAQGLLRIDEAKALALLAPLSADPVIESVIREHAS